MSSIVTLAVDGDDGNGEEEDTKSRSFFGRRDKMVVSSNPDGSVLVRPEGDSTLRVFGYSESGAVTIVEVEPDDYAVVAGATEARRMRGSREQPLPSHQFPAFRAPRPPQQSKRRCGRKKAPKRRRNRASTQRRARSTASPTRAITVWRGFGVGADTGHRRHPRFRDAGQAEGPQG